MKVRWKNTNRVFYIKLRPDHVTVSIWYEDEGLNLGIHHYADLPFSLCETIVSMGMECLFTTLNDEPKFFNYKKQNGIYSLVPDGE